MCVCACVYVCWHTCTNEQCAKPERCRDTTWRLPTSHRFALDKKLMRAPRWSLAAAPQVPCEPMRALLPNPVGCSQQAEEEEHVTDQAASAQSTSRANNTPASVSGGGIRAVRGLAGNLLAASRSTSPTCPSSTHESTRPLPNRPAATRPVSVAPSASSLQEGVPEAACAVGARQASGADALSFSAYAGPLEAAGAAGVSLEAKNRHEAEVERKRAMAHECQLQTPQERVLNHVRCTGCGRAARPNVLMFDDEDWVEGQTKLYKRYVKKALAAVKESGAKVASTKIDTLCL